VVVDELHLVLGLGGRVPPVDGWREGAVRLRGGAIGLARLALH
jgi:hypothetical protein